MYALKTNFLTAHLRLTYEVCAAGETRRSHGHRQVAQEHLARRGR